MARPNSPPRHKALPHGGAGRGLCAVFVGHDVEHPGEGGEQLAWRDEEIRITRPAQTFVALTEGLKNEDPALRQGLCEVREVGTVQVVGDDDPVERSIRKRPYARFKVQRADVGIRGTLEVRHAADVEIGGNHGVARG